MLSPFYVAEQKQLYPFRTKAITPDEIALEMNNLIEIGIETEKHLKNISLNEIHLRYFPMSDIKCFSILKGFEIYDFKYKRNN